jgi:hypothetical protein
MIRLLALLYNYSQLEQLTDWTPEWRLSDESLWRISHESRTDLYFLEFTNELPFMTAMRPESKSPCRTVNFPSAVTGMSLFSCLLPSNDSFFAILCSGNVITEPLLSNGRPFRFHYFGFQPSYHNIIKEFDVSVTGYFRPQIKVGETPA